MARRRSAASLLAGAGTASQQARVLAEFPFLSSVSCNCSQSIPLLPKPATAQRSECGYKKWHQAGLSVQWPGCNTKRAASPEGEEPPPERSPRWGEARHAASPRPLLCLTLSTDRLLHSGDTWQSQICQRKAKEAVGKEKKKKKATTGQCSLSHSESLRPKIGDGCFKNIIQITLGSICLG